MILNLRLKFCAKRIILHYNSISVLCVLHRLIPRALPTLFSDVHNYASHEAADQSSDISDLNSDMSGDDNNYSVGHRIGNIGNGIDS